jgi:hypothetical protein
MTDDKLSAKMQEVLTKQNNMEFRAEYDAFMKLMKQISPKHMNYCGNNVQKV